MNNYGVILNEIGFEPMLTQLQQQVLRPIASELFPTEVRGARGEGPRDREEARGGEARGGAGCLKCRGGRARGGVAADAADEAWMQLFVWGISRWEGSLGVVGVK